MNNKVIAVVGATATGKTEYAINLAKKLDGEIVSADSRLVYKDLNIATAKPTEDEMCGIPHYMIDIVSPEIDYSAGLYVKDAYNCIMKILNKGKLPIIVGGTGLYIKILLENYSLPDFEPDYKLREKLSQMTYNQLSDILYELDSDALSTLENNDKKKIIRYIEIVKHTGLPLKQSRGKSNSEFDVEWIGLNFPRDILYDRINKRVDLMVEKGMVEETEYLIKKYGRIPNIIDTIGYKEIISYFDNQCTLNEAVEKLKQNTRNYAKRQLTWFRKNEYIKWNFYPDKKKK